MQSMDTEPRDVPLCTRCLRPVHAGRYYCPHCGQATGEYTTYLPFVDIPFQVDFMAAWWKRATGPGLAWWRRIPMLLLLFLEVPIVVVICLLSLPWRAIRRRRAPDDSTPRA